MINWLASRARWVFLILALGGPVMGYLTWKDMQRIAAIKARGVGAEATVTGGNLRTGKRGTLSFDLEIAWNDAKAGERKAKVGVSTDYAHTVIRDGKITVATIPIRYVPGETGIAPLVANDPARQGDDNESFLLASAVAAVVGIVGWLAAWWVGRRRSA